MPALEITAQLLIEYTGPDLQELVGASWGPPHLLFLDQLLAHDLVDGGLDEAGGNRLAVPVAIRIVRDRADVGRHIAHELLKLALHVLRALGLGADIPRQVPDGL